MARFSGKIQSARFVDTDENTIEILYGIPPQLSSWVLSVDYTNQDFLDFLEEMDLIDVADATAKYYNRTKSTYDQEIEAKASQMAVAMAEEMFNKWLSNASVDVKAAYDKVDDYKEEQMRILENNASVDVKAAYDKVDDYKEEQMRILESELASERQDLARTAEEIDAKLSYTEVQKKYIKKEQDKLGKEKKSLLEKFRDGLGTPKTSSNNITGEEFVKLLFAKNEDEDFLFKAKLAVFNQDHVKNNSDREAKTAIKRSKNMIDLVVAMGI